MSFRVAMLAALAAFAVTMGTASAAQAAVSIGAVGSTTEVRPDQHPGVSGTATIQGAKGSFESFQVVIDSGAGGTAINNVDVSVTGTLTSGGNTIASSNIFLSRVDYQTITRPTDDESYGGSDPCPSSCRRPDALIPKVDYFYGQTRKAFTVAGFAFNVTAGENRVAWIDVQIPQGQAAGTYTGANIVVTSGGTTIGTIPISLEVFNFAMPATSTLTGGFGITPSRVCGTGDSIYATCAGAPGGNGWLMYSLISRAMLENRAPLARPALYGPGTDLANYRTYANPILNGTATRMAGAKPTNIFLNAAEGPNADDWQTEATTPGGAGAPAAYATKISYYCDEFGDTNADWATYCNNGYTTADGLWTGALPNSLIGTIDHLNWGRNTGNGGAGFPAAHNTKNIIPLVHRMHDKPGQPYGGNQRGNYNTFAGTAGNEVWMYNSCMSGGCTDPYTPGTYWVGWPGYFTDQPVSQTRAMGWQLFNYKTKGEYYFETLQRVKQAWTACGAGGTNCLYNEGGNGDGTLIYPGLTSIIGGTNDIPVESMRLKRIRDARQDYELMKYLAGGCAGSCAAVDEQDVLDITGGPYATGGGGLFTNTYSSTVTQAAFDAARQDLIDLLPGAGATCNGLAVTITGSGTINGTAGNDVILGSAGDDTISPGGGNDTVCAGDGYDYIYGSTGTDWIDGGNGDDGLDYAFATGAITINVGTSSVTGYGTTTVSNVTEFYGSPYNDTITGSAGANYLNGMGGVDTVSGAAGNDTVVGGDGDDTLDGGADNDTITGGNGTDLVTYAGSGAGVSGNLTGTMTGYGTDTLATLENITGSTYRDIISGNTANNVMTGGNGDDDLFGGDGADTLTAGDGADTLEGQLGNDTLDGGNGTDYVQYTSAASAVTVSLATGASSGGAGVDTISNVEDLGGSAYNDTLTGNGNNNYISGEGGADSLNGGAGADYYSGGDGNDNIYSRDTSTETVNCGNGTDVNDADFLDAVNANCETINRA